jgi:pyruvate formate lyase activating enzyme
MICPLCPHRCQLEKEGQHGWCRARVFKDGKIIDENYGRLTSLALDPIEKKPLRRFYPGSLILSEGSYGCNLKCPWCQNYEISQADQKSDWEYLSPEDLVRTAEKYVPAGNIGIAFTYNEPLVSYEYVMDTAKISKAHGLKTVLVTNGMINAEPLKALLPYIDALNIDLKGFTENLYRLCGGDLETVKQAIRLASASSHVEVTTLVIPGLNDSEAEMEKIAFFLSSISPDLPLHISRFFPRYLMKDKKPTPVETVLKLTQVAEKHLNFVYPGNI